MFSHEFSGNVLQQPQETDTGTCSVRLPPVGLSCVQVKHGGTAGSNAATWWPGLIFSFAETMQNVFGLWREPRGYCNFLHPLLLGMASSSPVRYILRQNTEL